MIVFIRIAGALISSFLICFSMAWINAVPKSEQLPNVYYSSFFESFMIPFTYSTFIFFIAAFPYSLVVDNSLSRIRIKRYFREMIAVILYFAGGAITLILFFAVLDGTIRRIVNFEMVLIGGVSAVVYYFVIRILEYLWYRRLNNRQI